LNKPQSVFQAEIAIWGTLAISAICALINKLIGDIGIGEFATSIIMYGILCIVPYKIGRGSNAARYFYTIVFVASILFLLGGMNEYVPKLDVIMSFVLIPVEIFIIYRLFQSDSTSWFHRKEIKTNAP